MQSVLATVFIVGAGAAAAKAKSGADPIGQVLSLCADLSAKVTKDGEAEQKAYEEYFEWCDDTSKEKQNEITTASAQKSKLEAMIGELTSEASVCDSKIADLIEAISSNGKDLAAATKIRKDEAGVFSSNDAELEDVVATLGKAMSALGGASSASFMQAANGATMANMLQSLSVVIEAAGMEQTDKKKLMALVQAHQQDQSDDDDSELGAPTAANYEKKSGSIVDILADMKDKASTQLSDLRKAENTAKQNFQKLKQSLTDQIGNDNMDLANQKKKKAGAEEGTATAEGDLEVTTADLKTATDGLASTQKNCMQVAIDHEDSVRARAEELKVIAMAIKIIKEATLVQTSTSDSSADSFVQLQSTTMQSISGKMSKLVRKLAKEHHSAALSQLASRINALARGGMFRTSDPFVKIRGMISDMIAKLDAQMGAEAQEKAYCDEEMGKTEEKKLKLETTSDKLTNKIDKSAARSAELKAQVKQLQEELATLARETEEMDTVRKDEHAVYLVAKADLEKALTGIRKALELLRDYYGASAAALVQEDASSDDSQPAAPQGHSKAGGAGGSIISILEVAESDMAKELAKIEAEESDEASAYEETTQNNKITKAAKDQDVKYKLMEAAGLDKDITELSNDRDQTNTELGAVNSYYTKLQGRCVAKPVSYEERKKAREAEIEGLKTALDVLENEAALVQRGSKNGHMRGSLAM